MVSVSYGVTIKHCDHVFDKTIEIYRATVSYLTDIALLHYDDLLSIKATEHGTAQQLRQRYIESLVHTVKNYERKKCRQMGMCSSDRLMVYG